MARRFNDSIAWSLMSIAGHDIGVCSWSLHPRDTQDLVASVQKLGLRHVQLALVGIAMADDKVKHRELGVLRNSDLTLTAGSVSFPGEDYSTLETIKRTGGFAPDDDFILRRQVTRTAALLASELRI